MSDKDEVIDLEEFHAGGRGVLRAVYHRYVRGVERSVSRYCRGADAQCVTHDVFLSLIEKPHVRAQFTGGDMGAWLRTMATRRAIDLLRRRRRCSLLDDPCSLEGRLEPIQDEERLLARDQEEHLKRALELFSRERLPRLDQRLASVFRLRFQRHLSQKAAARELEIPRSTFINLERRLMKQLGAYLRRQLGERRS